MKTTISFFKWLQTSTRKFSTSKSVTQPEVGASIYLSTCHDVYKNLAFEDWIYEKTDLSKQRILFIWKNRPSVVIGRHQNPWQECNLPRLKENNIKLARRKSGGGTVYHDLGNLNLTFFTHRSLYNRQENLALVVKVLRERWKLNVKASPRDDILLEDKYKISGTSSKLGRVKAYHHCTLLLDVDTEILHDVLQPTYSAMVTNATPSIKSEVKNMSSLDASLNYNDVAMAISEEYSNAYTARQQPYLHVIDPSDNQQFPGIDNFAKELKSWQWLFGKTPKFELPLSTMLSSGDSSMVLKCYHGIIQDVHTETSCQSLESVSRVMSSSLKGVRFHPEDMLHALQELKTSEALSHMEEQYINDIQQWLNCVIL